MRRLRKASLASGGSLARQTPIHLSPTVLGMVPKLIQIFLIEVQGALQDMNEDRALALVMELMSVPGISGEEAAIAQRVVDVLRQAGIGDHAIQFDTAHRRTPVKGQRPSHGDGDRQAQREVNEMRCNGHGAVARLIELAFSG